MEIYNIYSNSIRAKMNPLRRLLCYTDAAFILFLRALYAFILQELLHQFVQRTLPLRLFPHHPHTLPELLDDASTLLGC